MPILVKDLLNLLLLEDARVVAGLKGIGRRTISWISVIEWPVEGFVRPGEMMLTCGTEGREQFISSRHVLSLSSNSVKKLRSDGRLRSQALADLQTWFSFQAVRHGVVLVG